MTADPPPPGDRSGDAPAPAPTVSSHTVPVEGFEYYRDRYWNDFPEVRAQLNERATDDRAVTWYEHLRDTSGPFRHALVLNCGTGWVERDLIAHGVIESAVGVDVSEALLAQARQGAADLGLPLRYVRCDTNAAQFPDEPFDLVVNHAAMHHVAYIDRVVRRLHELLAPGGVFAFWDYVGPHRNQYTARQWEAAWDANLTLPEHLRQTMRYPSLPTMLATDPTEAIHSELILPTVERYFDLEHRRDLGGAIGYLLLTHHAALHALPAEEASPHVAAVMAADAALTAAEPATNLFAYLIARPRPGALDDAARLAVWSSAEAARETAAAEAGGTYYPPTAIAALAEPLVELEEQAARCVDPVTALAELLDRTGDEGAVTPEMLVARIGGRALVTVLLRRQRARLGLLAGWVRRRHSAVSARSRPRRSAGGLG